MSDLDEVMAHMREVRERIVPFERMDLYGKLTVLSDADCRRAGRLADERLEYLKGLSREDRKDETKRWLVELEWLRSQIERLEEMADKDFPPDMIRTHIRVVSDMLGRRDDDDPMNGQWDYDWKNDPPDLSFGMDDEKKEAANG